MKKIKVINQRINGYTDILSTFLDDNQLAEFNDKLESSIRRPKKVPVEKLQRGIVLPSKEMPSSNLILFLDSLITFIMDKLKEDQILDLLFNLSKLSISQGELNFAKEINQKIIKKTKKCPEFINSLAHAYLSLGDINSRQAQWKESIQYIKKAEKYFQQSNDAKNLVGCENLLGSIYAEQGNLKRAKIHFEKGLEALDEKKDKYTLAMFEVNLGIINNINGEFDSAHSYFYRALLSFEELSDLRRMAEIHHNIGMLYSQKEEYKSALKEFDSSLKISINERLLPTLAISLIGKAYVYAQIEDLSLALAFADRGMDVSLEINDRLSVADCYKIKGIVKRKQKKYKTAANFLLTSLRINEDHGNKLNYAETAYELGLLYQQMRDTENANKYFKEALNYYKHIDYKAEVVKIKKFLQ